MVTVPFSCHLMTQMECFVVLPSAVAYLLTPSYSRGALNGFCTADDHTSEWFGFAHFIASVTFFLIALQSFCFC